MNIFNDILKKHTSVGTCKDSYMMNEDIEITVSQDGCKVVIWAFNHRSNRFVNLGTKRFKKLIDGFSEVASDLYGKGDYYYITINNMVDDKSDDVDIDKLKSEIEFLKLKVSMLEDDNKRLVEEIEKNSIAHNVRGAGRKARFSDDEISQIKELRLDGSSIKEIATRFKCSVGLIHKLINEKQRGI